MIVEMLNTTNVVVLVGQNDFGDFSPRKVTIWSTSTNSVLCSSWPFANKITMTGINKNRMYVIEKNLMHIYTTGDMKILHTLEVGIISPGKLVMSPSADKNNFICFSTSIDEGIVKIYDLNYLSFKTSIRAHKSQIMKMAINNKGDFLATCSEKGTIIRIFSLPKGDKLFTYKRGISAALIYSINFSLESDKIIMTSDTGTLHVFDLKENSNKEDNINNNNNLHNSNLNGISSYVTNWFSNITSKIIPKDYEDYLVPRSIISFNGSFLKKDNIVSFNPKDITEAYCFTFEGSFYLFNINYENKTIFKINQSEMKDLRLII